MGRPGEPDVVFQDFFDRVRGVGSAARRHLSLLGTPPGQIPGGTEPEGFTDMTARSPKNRPPLFTIRTALLLLCSLVTAAGAAALLLAAGRHPAEAALGAVAAFAGTL